MKAWNTYCKVIECIAKTLKLDKLIEFVVKIWIGLEVLSKIDIKRVEAE